MGSMIRGVLAMLLVAGNTLWHVPILLLVALLKLLLPIASVRRGLSRTLIVIAQSWVGFNSWLIDRLTPTRFELDGIDSLPMTGWYLVICNHQSWVDIPVLQKVFNRRIPFLKFFLKRQLIWVPLLGLAWWALDFPFMRRYSKAFVQRNPHLRGTDIEITRRACARFRHVPVAVMNFVEGTRFRPEKHAAQGSPYRHLLRPRAGGIGFVLGAMNGVLTSLLDVTVAYPDGRPTLWQMFSGQVTRVCVQVRQRPIPGELAGDYENDAALRERVQDWINAVWRQKDDDLDALLTGRAAPSASEQS